MAAERPVFGITPPPPAAEERMAYVARRPSCGHIVIAQADSRRESLQDFVSYGLAGFTLERIPSAQVREEGMCACPQPEQVRGLW